MLNAIKTHVLDLLYNDIRLMQGGTAYSPGWPGATRERFNLIEDFGLVDLSGTGTIPIAGYVNIFDRAYAKEPLTSKPGIYTGATLMETTDEIERACASDASVAVEFRRVTIPLFITCVDSDYYTAQNMRDQLRFNVKKILDSHRVDRELGLWYHMRMPGKHGGSEATEKDWSVRIGDQTQGKTEAICLLPIAISYQWSLNSQYA